MTYVGHDKADHYRYLPFIHTFDVHIYLTYMPTYLTTTPRFWSLQGQILTFQNAVINPGNLSTTTLPTNDSLLSSTTTTAGGGGGKKAVVGGGGSGVAEPVLFQMKQAFLCIGWSAGIGAAGLSSCVIGTASGR